MSGYIVYWPQEQVRKLKRMKDAGPIQVILGSVHTKMPSIAQITVGDVIYPVTLEGKPHTRRGKIQPYVADTKERGKAD